MVDVPALALWCAALDADVLALQEVDVAMARSGRADTVAVVAAACEMDAAFGPALTVGRGRYGVALLVRGLVTSHEVVPLAGPPGAEPRVALVGRVAVDHEELSIVVAHLSPEAPRPQLDEVGRLAQEQSGPLVLLGDLNVGGDVCRPALAERGLALVSGDDPTFPASAPVARIDHLATRGVTAERSWVLPRAPVSDHLALAADVAQPPGGSPLG